MVKAAQNVAKRQASTQTIAKRMTENLKAPTVELANDKATLNGILAVYKAKTGKDLAISLATLDGIVEHAGEKWDEMDEDEIVSFLQNAQKEVAKVSIGDANISSLVNILETDEEFARTLDENIEATKKAKTTGLSTYAQFKRIYTREQLDAMAWPGTKSDSGEYVKGTNRRADIVTKTAANGDEIVTKWIEDFVGKHKRGKECDANIALAQKELKSSNSVPSLKHMGKRQLEDMVKEWTADRNAFRSMVRRAISLHHALTQIEAMPEVVLEIKTSNTEKHILIPAKFGLGKHDASDSKASRSPSPFWMYPVGKSSDGKSYSHTQIINMNVDAAIKAGGTMKALVDTLSTGSDDPKAGTDGKDWDVDEATDNMSQVVNFFGLKGNRSAVNKALTALRDPKASAEAKTTAKDLLENIGSINGYLNPIIRKYRAEYDEITEGESPHVADNTEVVDDETDKQAAA